MRAVVLGTVLSLALGGTTLAASPSGSTTPAVVIEASQGQPAGMASYPGPRNTGIPMGACGAVMGGKVWVLPCSDQRVVLYRHDRVAAAARAHGRQASVVAGLVVYLGALTGGMAELWQRRRTRRGV